MQFHGLQLVCVRRRASLFGWAMLATAACSGSIGGQSGGDGEGGGKGTVVPPRDPPAVAACSARQGRPAWKLSTNTAFQTRMIVGQVFGADAVNDAQVQSLLSNIPSNLRAKGFDTENKAIAGQFVDGLVALAGRLGAMAAEQESVRKAIESFVGRDCSGTLNLAEGCGQELARDFVAAFERGPVVDEDIAFLVDTYKSNKTKYQEPKAYAGFVASALLSAKSALRFDSAEFDMQGNIDGHSLGARLAITLTGGLPDAGLRAKIDDGSIVEVDTLKSEAQRLMRTPAGRETLRHFAHQWLNIAELKSPPGAPGFVPTTADSELMAKAAREEIGRLFENAVLDKGGKLEDFFGTNEVVPAHDWLAKLYGTQTGTELEQTTRDERQGLLSRVAFNLHGAFAPYLPLAHRGYGVKVTMLCGSIGALPDMIDTTLPSTAPEVMSSRQFFEVLTEQGSCKGCHAAMNPYGYAMSAFSVTAEHLTRETVKNRMTEAMEDVDVLESVRLRLDGSEQEISDASALSVALGQSAQAKACFAHRLDQFVVGQQEEFLCSDDDDGAAIPAVDDLSLEDTILAYVVSSAFSAR